MNSHPRYGRAAIMEVDGIRACLAEKSF